MECINYYHGTPIFITEIWKDELEYRRNNKNYRINKKWHKRYGKHRVPNDDQFYLINGKIFMTKGLYRKIRKVLDNQND